MFRRRLVVEAVGDVAAGHRAVAGEVVGVGLLDTILHRPGQLARERVGLALDAVGAVVAGAALDGGDLRIRHQLQYLARLRADLLHALVARHLPGDLAQRRPEVGLQQAGLVPFGQVLERVEEALAHQRDVGVIGEHQRQFLLEHQHAGRDRRGEVPAFARHLRQHRDVALLVFLHRLQVAQFQLGHAAAAFLFDQPGRDRVVLQHHGEILDHHRVGVVAIAGGEQRDLAARAAGRNRFAAAVEDAQAFARGGRVVFGHACLRVDAHGLFQQLARGRVAVGGVDHLHHHRDRGELADGARAGQDPRRQRRAVTLERHRLGAQHQVREIHVPRVRRRVRALGLVAQVAQVALLGDLRVVGLVDAVDLHGRRRVDQVEQGGEGVAQADAAAAAVADVEHAFQFGIQRLLVHELGVGPVQRMPPGRVQVAFARALGGIGHRLSSRGSGADSHRHPGRSRDDGRVRRSLRPCRPVPW